MDSLSLHLTSAPELVLSQALLIYKSAETPAYVTSHQVHRAQKGPPTLGAGVPLTTADLADFVKWANQKTTLSGWLHERLIFTTANFIAWWRPAQSTTLFFDTRNHEPKAHLKVGLRTGSTPQPALVFAANENEWYVWALRGNERPGPASELCVAPYLNVWKGGRICTGNVKLPDDIDARSIDQFEKAFFRSRFTHPNQDRLVDYRGGSLSLWAHLLKTKPAAFPTQALLPAKETLQQAITRVLKAKS